MKTTRTYLSCCTWCGATGIVPNQMIKGSTITAPLTIACPVCNGAKTVIVTETIDDSQKEITDEEILKEAERYYPFESAKSTNIYGDEQNRPKVFGFCQGAKWMRDKLTKIK